MKILLHQIYTNIEKTPSLGLQGAQYTYFHVAIGIEVFVTFGRGYIADIYGGEE